MADGTRIKDGLYLDNFSQQIFTHGLSFDPTTGKVGYMSTSSFGSGSGGGGGTTIYNTGSFIATGSVAASVDVGNTMFKINSGSNTYFIMNKVTGDSTKAYFGINTTSPTNALHVIGNLYQNIGKVVLDGVGNATTAVPAVSRIIMSDSSGQLYYTSSAAYQTPLTFPNHTNTAFVSPGGNDGTAIIGNINKPFNTIYGAVGALYDSGPFKESNEDAAATVWVFPGVYLDEPKIQIRAINDGIQRKLFIKFNGNVTLKTRLQSEDNLFDISGSSNLFSTGNDLSVYFIGDEKNNILTNYLEPYKKSTTYYNGAVILNDNENTGASGSLFSIVGSVDVSFTNITMATNTLQSGSNVTNTNFAIRVLDSEDEDQIVKLNITNCNVISNSCNIFSEAKKQILSIKDSFFYTNGFFVDPDVNACSNIIITSPNGSYSQIYNTSFEITGSIWNEGYFGETFAGNAHIDTTKAGGDNIMRWANNVFYSSVAADGAYMWRGPDDTRHKLEVMSLCVNNKNYDITGIGSNFSARFNSDHILINESNIIAPSTFMRF